MGDGDSIQHWLHQAEQGDEEAAAFLVQNFEAELRRYVRYRLRDPRLRVLLDSLDISQSVFCRFFSALGQGRIDVSHPRQLTKLLQTMAMNRVRDHARRRAAIKRSAPVDEDGQIPAEELVDQAERPAERAMTYEIVDVIRAELSDEEREILDRRVAGEGWSEIASAVDSRPDAVRKRFTRAIDRAAGTLGLN